MADTKGKVKQQIDNAAEKAKDMAGKGIDRTKEAGQTAGEKLKDAGKKLKKASS